MSDPEFDSALAIVLSKISDDPTLLNSLPHDILRKLIMHVGTLDINQTVEINGEAYKLKSIIEALNRPCATSRNRVDFSSCSHCDYIEAWSLSRDRVCYCGCGDCDNMVCENCISSNGYCPSCERYEDTDCLYCIEQEREMDAAAN